MYLPDLTNNSFISLGKKKSSSKNIKVKNEKLASTTVDELVRLPDVEHVPNPSTCPPNKPVLLETKELKQFTFDQFCQRITSHGFLDLYLAVSFSAKLFWSIVIVFSLLLTGYYIYDEISEYIECPILTTISFKPQKVMRFPVVYICPFQFAFWQLIQKCGNATEFKEKINVLKSGNNYAKILGGMPNRWHEIAKYLQNILISENSKIDDGSTCPDIDLDKETFQDYIMRQALTVPMFLRECSFVSQELDCSRIATQILDKEFGVCYLIDLTRAGTTNSDQKTANLGLSLVIDIQHEQAQHDPGELPGALVDGIIVRLNDRYDPGAFGGHLVQPGTYTKLSLSGQKDVLISYIGSLTPQLCTVNEEHKFYALHNVGYTQDSCRMDCALKIMILECGCILPIDNRYLNRSVINFELYEQICDSPQFENCITPALATSKEYNTCIGRCYKACRSLEIDVESSQATFPSQETRTKMQNFQDTHVSASNVTKTFTPQYQGPLNAVDIVNMERWSKNLIVLDIAYKNLQYTVLEQRPSRSYTSLIANVGGQAGLWTGASIFTLLQTVIFTCYLFCSARKRKSSSCKSPDSQ